MEIYLGHNKDGNRVELDFEKEEISFVLLVGNTGSGKSAFHRNLYKKLSEKYSSKELGFVFLDMTGVDFTDWKSEYLYKPVVTDPKGAIQALYDLVAEKPKKRIVVHIEECDILNVDRKAVEAALMKLQELKNVLIVYSTSRIDKTYLGDWMKQFVNLRVVFSVSTEGDSIFLLGDNSASHFEKKGERILSFNGRQIYCRPFSEDEVEA